ncbi:MAG: type VI secretion system tube protein Hcp [Pseudomonadota bacterium]
MALDTFLKLKNIDGEAQDDKHKNSIDVLSWSWGMTQSGTTHLGSGSGSGKVNVQDIVFTKFVDKSTPAILKHCCNGKHIDSGKLTVRKAGGDSQVEYLVIEMENIIISSYQTGGSSDGLDRVQETIGLNFGKVKSTYQEQTKDGGGGPKSGHGWDIPQNKEHS